MFKNVSSKIKWLAKFCAYACVSCGSLVAVVGLVFYAPNAYSLEYANIYGSDFFTEAVNAARVGLQMLKYGLGSAVAGFLSAWPLYGFGELIENVNIIANNAPKDDN